jgi:hypothetical protein
MGNRNPTRVGGGARALGSHRVPWPTYQSEPEGGCEAKTCRGDPSFRELVAETGCLASVGLDRGP